jgi:beta-glucosidase
MRSSSLVVVAGLWIGACALGTLAACPADGGGGHAKPGKTGFRALEFPSDFRWGTATAGWQVEGDTGSAGTYESNWSRWMAMGRAKGLQTNPDGNGFRAQYLDDIQRAKALGLTSFRLSADWSKIEPAPDQFDADELQHLDDVVTAVKAAGMDPVLTLYHWAVPTWVQNPDADFPGGKVDRIAQKSRDVVDDWEDFVRHVIPVVKDKVDTYTVLNEPLTMVVVGYLNATFPPGVFFDIPTATDFGINLVFMHARAFDVIKELDDVDADGDGDASFVGLTMTANDIYPEDPSSDQENLAADSLNYVYNDWFIQALTSGDLDVNLDGEVDEDAVTNPAEGSYPELAGRLEFIGVQYYGPVKVKEVAFLVDTAPLYGLPLTDVDQYSASDDKNLPHNGMGREISAAGFADTLDRYAKWDLPLIVTENGTTTNVRPNYPDDGTGPIPAPVFDEDQAAMYLVTHLWEVGRAMQRGVDIRGYFHWTLADNYEWVEGRLQRFGAYHVDFADPAYPRTLSKMGEALQAVTAAGGIDEALWHQWVQDQFGTDTTTKGQGATTSEPVVGPLP